MKFDDNPFYVLEVTPFDTADTINEKYDYKSFEDDKNERRYDDARDILLSPIKRLTAEVRWFFDTDLDETHLLDELVVYPYIDDKYHFVGEEKRLTNPRENLIANIEKFINVPREYVTNYIIEIDKNYAEACDSEQIYDLIDNINISRRKAKISLCKDYNL